MPGPRSVRLLLLGLSAGGLVGAAVLWAQGHPGLAARVLAGDLLLMFLILLAV